MEGRTEAPYAGFITAGLEDELLRLVVPAWHGGKRRGLAGGAQGQAAFSLSLELPVELPILGETQRTWLRV